MDFGQQPRVNHGLDPPVDARVEGLAVDGQTDLEGFEPFLRKSMAVLQGGDRLARAFQGLEGTDDAKAVVGVDSRGTGRVAVLQGGVQHAEALRRGPVFEPAADLRVGRSGIEQPELEGFDIESGPPGHHRQGPLPMQPMDARRRHGRVTGGVEGFVRFDHVDHVVGGCGLFRGRRLGRADIHLAIDLHRIGPDDFPFKPSAQIDSGRGLADAGGTADNHQAGMIGRVAHMPQINRV